MKPQQPLKSRSIDISSLSHEILLSIFSHLDCNQITISRRVSKNFLEVMDHNQLLWRELEWVQKNDQKSFNYFKPALDMFDEKSGSTIERLSIQGQYINDNEREYLMQVLDRSKRTMRCRSLTSPGCEYIQDRVLELIPLSHHLNQLILFPSNGCDVDFPISHLVPLKKEPETEAEVASSTRLQVLWVENFAKLNVNLLNSLVSYAQGDGLNPQECQSLISNFSETSVHLKLGVTSGLSSVQVQPLLCPNLTVLEGYFMRGVSSLFICPKLRYLVLEQVEDLELEGIPSSVEELWLNSRKDSFRTENWEPLVYSCPRLQVLKLSEDFVYDSDFGDKIKVDYLLEMMENRNKMVKERREVDGVQFTSLQKLILPTGLFSKSDLDRLEKMVESLIDLKDYPEFIEIEY